MFVCCTCAETIWYKIRKRPPPPREKCCGEPCNPFGMWFRNLLRLPPPIITKPGIFFSSSKFLSVSGFEMFLQFAMRLHSGLSSKMLQKCSNLQPKTHCAQVTTISWPPPPPKKGPFLGGGGMFFWIFFMNFWDDIKKFYTTILEG